MTNEIKEQAQDERELFDKWHVQAGKGLRLYSSLNEHEQRIAWDAWQARAALAQKPEAQGVKPAKVNGVGNMRAKIVDDDLVGYFAEQAQGHSAALAELEQKLADANEAIDAYAEAGRVIALHLKKFMPGTGSFSEAIAEAARRAGASIATQDAQKPEASEAVTTELGEGTDTRWIALIKANNHE